MCNLETAEESQLILLQEVLLHGKHYSPEPWFNYVKYLRQKAPHRRFLLKRLLTKVFKLLDMEKYRDNRSYIDLHLLMTELLDADDAIEYFENSIWSNGIGRRSAAIYTQWARLTKDSVYADKILRRVSFTIFAR